MNYLITYRVVTVAGIDIFTHVMDGSILSFPHNKEDIDKLISWLRSFKIGDDKKYTYQLDILNLVKLE
jgi:erythromycin esterase-like protein